LLLAHCVAIPGTAREIAKNITNNATSRGGNLTGHKFALLATKVLHLILKPIYAILKPVVLVGHLIIGHAAGLTNRLALSGVLAASGSHLVLLLAGKTTRGLVLYTHPHLHGLPAVSIAIAESLAITH
jgi:hypothetical protein